VAVTNAPRDNAEQLLDSIGARRRFRGLVIGDELDHGKPDPLPSLVGLRIVGANGENCVAFEASRAGLNSAASAGIATIGMATGLELGQLLEAGATLAARDYTDPVMLEFIAERVGASETLGA